MATKQAVNKTQAVLDYLKAHPGAMSKEIVTALNEQGIRVRLGYISQIKTKVNKIAASPAVEKSADTLTADQIKTIAQAIKRIRLRWSRSEHSQLNAEMSCP